MTPEMERHTQLIITESENEVGERGKKSLTGTVGGGWEEACAQSGVAVLLQRNIENHDGQQQHSELCFAFICLSFMGYNGES